MSLMQMYALRSLQEFVNEARENSALYRRRLIEWEKKAIAQGHPELVRKELIRKSAPRVRAAKPKVKPAANTTRRKATATTPKVGVKKDASTQTSGLATGKSPVKKTAASRKKKLTVEE